jgi:predicted metal-dependent hydrolase
MNAIDFGTRKIIYNLHREERKRMRIVVAPALTVDVFAPATASEEQIQSAVMKKAARISGKLDALERYHPLPAPKKYISGETLIYLGRQYRLKVEQGRSQSAKLMGRFLRVWVDDKSDTHGVRKKVDAWYHKRAHETLGR